MASVVAARPRTKTDFARTLTIVDDDLDTQKLLRMTLEMEGYHVNVAANGLELLQDGVHKPDLFILDVMLSWMDGFDLCKAIKRNAVMKDVPVIFITGRDSPQDMQRGFACGAVDYITKPFDVDKLLRRIAELVRAS